MKLNGIPKSRNGKGSSRPSGRAGWIVGGLPGHAPLPTDQERKEWAKKFNGKDQSQAAK